MSARCFQNAIVACGLLAMMAATTMFGAASDQGKPATPPAPKVHQPAVAGLFYPKESTELGAMLDKLLAAANPPALTNVRAIICPHAGYIYSGPTAAYSYKTVQGANFSTAIILAPSHYAWFEGASVCSADLFRTPLGDIQISPRARKLAERKPFGLEIKAQVERPGWAAQASRPMPATGEDTPDTWEHSLEVQIPFLQKVLPRCQIVPVVMGQTDPAAAARALEDFIDAQTLIIASSDLSHYHPYNDAKVLDQQCVQAICDLDLERMLKQEACGKTPILTVMYIAKMKGWKPRLLDYRNSGDTAGDKRGVVGYAAIAFTAEPPSALTPAERQWLLKLARQTLNEVVRKGTLPEINKSELTPNLAALRGCFVTLTIAGELRGCIGHISPQMPLAEAVRDNARNAALRDPRFQPVRPDELDKIEIEISVLTVPEPIEFKTPEELLARLRPKKDGVVLHIGGREATFLPQVWEQLPDKVDFLNHLAAKAGAQPSAWRQPGVKVFIYTVEAFHEKKS